MTSGQWIGKKRELRMGQCQHRFMTPVSDVKWMLIPQEGSLLEVTSQSLGYSPTKWGCTNHLKSLPWAFRLMLFKKTDMPPLSSKRVTGFPSTTTVWTSSLSSTITSLDWIRTPETFPKWSEKHETTTYLACTVYRFSYMPFHITGWYTL